MSRPCYERQSSILRSMCSLLLSLTVLVNLSAQDSEWRTYDGRHFRFSYPPQLQLREMSEADVSVSNNEIDIEIAISHTQAKGNEQMVLNAEKHVSDFAAANKMGATFEGWKEMGPDAVLVISHLRSSTVAIDVVSTMRRNKNSVLLLQVMHAPGARERATDVAAQVGRTITLKDQ